MQKLSKDEQKCQNQHFQDDYHLVWNLGALGVELDKVVEMEMMMMMMMMWEDWMSQGPVSDPLKMNKKLNETIEDIWGQSSFIKGNL